MGATGWDGVVNCTGVEGDGYGVLKMSFVTTGEGFGGAIKVVFGTVDEARFTGEAALDKIVEGAVQQM